MSLSLPLFTQGMAVFVMFTGHYVADVFCHRDKKWHKCDDSLISTVSSADIFCDEARQREAYLLFYCYE